ncbi:uncharacterized protein Dsimw501_GD27049, isoform C [Drosophila simulans]|nr:uncharacterized protein Dsimw501_GD27049, isoform A [Drosophila simulans]KMY86987.1 uncharacterized protein Dsimw501_GD27049, isoform B [Drosophila simulans]KMY86988.1 uncharacterized protein Dsimw501_GD27049, isoform C [Drosophila simulans]
MLTKKTAGIKMCNGVIACSIALILIKAITITKCHAVAHMHGKYIHVYLYNFKTYIILLF